MPANLDKAFATLMLGAALVTATASSQAATYVYVGHGGASEIRVLALSPADGSLTAVESVAFPGMVKAGGSMPMALSPDKKLLYAGLRGEPLAVATFRIDPASGRLAHLGTGPLADSMAYISTDRTGRWLLSASYGGNKIAVNPIGSDGVVQPASQVVPTEPNAHSILTDPSNRHVLAASLGGDILIQQRFDAATGTLSPNDPPSAGVQAKAGPRHFVFNADASRVYLMNELDGTVTAFDYDGAKGRLTSRQTVSAVPAGQTAKPSAADIHLTPDGSLLYASERTSSTLAAFRVDRADGSLTPAGSYPTEKTPRGFNIDPTGRWLLAVGQGSDSLTVHAIDAATGALTEVKRYPMAKSPDWVEIVIQP